MISVCSDVNISNEMFSLSAGTA